MLAAAALLGMCAVLFWFDPARCGFYPVCLFRRTTGLLCPGCGGLRATHQLLHGHVAEAFRLNALFVLALPLVAWAAVRALVCRLRRQPVKFQIPRACIWVGLGMLLLFAIGRNVI